MQALPFFGVEGHIWPVLRLRLGNESTITMEELSGGAVLNACARGQQAQPEAYGYGLVTTIGRCSPFHPRPGFRPVC